MRSSIRDSGQRNDGDHGMSSSAALAPKTDAATAFLAGISRPVRKKTIWGSIRRQRLALTGFILPLSRHDRHHWTVDRTTRTD